MSFSPSFFHDPVLGPDNIASTSSYAMNEGSEAQLQGSCIGAEDNPFLTCSEDGGITATNYTSPSDESYGASSTESIGSQLSGSSNDPGSLRSYASGVNRTVGTSAWINNLENSGNGSSRIPLISAFKSQEHGFEEWTSGFGNANSYDMTSVPLNSQVPGFSNYGFTPDYNTSTMGISNNLSTSPVVQGSALDNFAPSFTGPPNPNPTSSNQIRNDGWPSTMNLVTDQTYGLVNLDSGNGPNQDSSNQDQLMRPNHKSKLLETFYVTLTGVRGPTPENSSSNGIKEHILVDETTAADLEAALGHPVGSQEKIISSSIWGKCMELLHNGL